MGKKDDRLNETRINNDGEEMRIIRYGNSKDIDVEFIKDGVILEHRDYKNFKKGEIKNPMTPSVYGVGYMGIGKFKSRDENGKHTKCHKTWQAMHQRCYDSNYQEKYTTYKNCRVCKEWNDYNEFGKWFDENYYEIEGQRMALDKDILKKGNKVYSPDTCVFVPSSINNLFVKRDKSRGELPIGVSKKGNKFVAQLNKDNERIYLGLYSTAEEAFQVYKKAKEAYIKEVAEEYKDKIPYRLYEALINYEVEIDD